MLHRSTKVSVFGPREPTPKPATGLKRVPFRPKRSGLSTEQKQAYKADVQPDWCYACGCNEPLDHSHILTQRQHPQHRANPLNWLFLCRTCHSCWEDNKARFKQRYPEAFAEKMRRMKLLDAQAYAFFRMKWPALFQ